MDTEKPYRFFVNKRWVELTSHQIDNLPKLINNKEEELKELQAIHKEAKNYKSDQFKQLMGKYYARLSAHMLRFSSGTQLKFLCVLIEPKFSPSFFVRAEIELTKDNSFKSICLIEPVISETKQIVQMEKSYLFRHKNTISTRTSKANKQKFKRVAEIIKENYIQRSQPNSDKCNTMLKGWIAELF